MKRKEVVNFLASHADALIKGMDMTPRFRSRFPEDLSELAPLLQLAEAVKDALPPVPSPEFKKKLGRKLLEYGPAEITVNPSIPQLRWLWLAVAGVTSALSITGVVLLLLRRSKVVRKPSGHPAATIV